MIESFYGNGLLLLGLWTATSIIMVFLWGLLAWAVVNLIARRGPRRRRAGDVGDRDWRQAFDRHRPGLYK